MMSCGEAILHKRKSFVDCAGRSHFGWGEPLWMEGGRMSRDGGAVDGSESPAGVKRHVRRTEVGSLREQGLYKFATVLDGLYKRIGRRCVFKRPRSRSPMGK